MITVTIIDTKDEAEAATPEAALLAALTMGQEARESRSIWGFNPRVTFTVDGSIIRSTTLRDLQR